MIAEGTIPPFTVLALYLLITCAAMNAITSIAGKVQSSFGINARKRYRKAFAGRSERPFAWLRCLSKATRVFGRRIQMVTKAGPSNEASPESALGSLTHTETRKAHVMKGTRTSNFVAAVIVDLRSGSDMYFSKKIVRVTRPSSAKAA